MIINFQIIFTPQGIRRTCHRFEVLRFNEQTKIIFRTAKRLAIYICIYTTPHISIDLKS